MPRPVYLDCNATTPIDPRVADRVLQLLTEDFGNAASRTHDYGVRAKKVVEHAREQVAAVVGSTTDEVIFTSGATESDNLALFGLREHARSTGRRHIVTTAIEHKAVLEPISALEEEGFEVTYIRPDTSGAVPPEAVLGAVRPDTLLVSMMHANNETGVLQPLEAIADGLASRDVFLHVDAAQTYGKVLEPLRSKRIDLISVSGHKIFAPQGVGALIVRRRDYRKPPLTPLLRGGGHERGLRPGTLPVALISGLGLASELAVAEQGSRRRQCQAFRAEGLLALQVLEPAVNGDQALALPHVLNVSFLGLDSEAIIVALKDLVAISNGSACTSHSYEPSHVLRAMGLPEERVRGAIRFSWCHMTPPVPWAEVVTRLRSLAH